MSRFRVGLAVVAMVMSTAVVPVVSAAGGGVATAQPACPVIPATPNSTFTLTGNCDTTVPIVVPSSVTLNGAGFTITASDMTPGSFNGGVVTATATGIMHVENLKIQGKFTFSGSCGTRPLGLYGIWFNNANGSVSNVTVTGITENSGCQDGRAIEADAVTRSRTVTISNTTVSDYNKSGITASGTTSGTMTLNVSGSTIGPPPSLVGLIAQNGLEYLAGTTGTTQNSTIYGSGDGVQDTSGTAVLLDSATNVTLTHNTLTGAGSDDGIYVYQSTGITISFNAVGRTTPDSPDIDGVGIPVCSSNSPAVVAVCGTVSVFSSATLTCNSFSGWKTNIVGAVQAVPCTTPPIPAFRLLPGGASDIAVGADGSVWAVGTNPTGVGFGIWHWTGSTWVELHGSAVAIGVDPKGNPWVTNALGQIYQWTGTGFVLRPGGATDIAVGADGSVWVVGTNPTGVGFGIWHWTGSTWVELHGSAVAIGVDPNGNPWVTNALGQIYQWTGTGFALYPGGATDIDVGADGSVWVVGTNPTGVGFGIWRWVGSGWAEVGGSAVAIGVAPTGVPWVVNSRNQIYAG